jgi:hypothetical protein
VGVALFGSVIMSVVVFFGVRLQGSFLAFWMIYFATICVGIGGLRAAPPRRAPPPPPAPPARCRRCQPLLAPSRLAPDSHRPVCAAAVAQPFPPLQEWPTWWRPWRPTWTWRTRWVCQPCGLSRCSQEEVPGTPPAGCISARRATSHATADPCRPALRRLDAGAAHLCRHPHVSGQ